MPRHTMFVTIATTDHLPRVAVLAHSLREAYGPEKALLLALHLGEEVVLPSAVPLDLFELVPFARLSTPLLWDFAFRYDKRALAHAMKPFFIEHVLRNFAPKDVIFLDAEAHVYNPLEEVEQLLQNGASIILSPHFERPQVRLGAEDKARNGPVGVINNGFVALANDANAEKFLAWWSSRFSQDEGRGPAADTAVDDGRELDAVPALFAGVHVLRNRGYNATHRNFPDRSPMFSQERWWIGASPLCLFNFRGWCLEEGETVEQAAKRLFGSDDANLAKLLMQYRDQWKAAVEVFGPEIAQADYAFDFLVDDTAIPDVAREAYRKMSLPRPWTREQIFGEGLPVLLRRSVDLPLFPGVEITDLYVHLWEKREDTKHHDLQTRAGQLGMIRWILADAAAAFELPDGAIEPARWTWEREAERERRAKALRGRARDLHNRIRHGRSSPGELLPIAGEIMDIFRARSGLPPRLKSTRTESVAGFFRAIRILRREGAPGMGCPNVQRLFDDIEAHGKYLASKIKTDYRAFLEAGGPAGEPLLEADAVLNACSVLVELFEQWLDLGDLPVAPLAPESIFSDVDSAAPSGAVASWAHDQLRELGAIEPRLALQIEENEQEFRVSRIRPRHHPLLRCFDDHRNVLEPPPLAVLAFPCSDRAGEFDRFGLVEAAQEKLGRDSVLVMLLEEDGVAHAAGFDQGTRVFRIGRAAPYLSSEQQFEFVRDYVAGAQPAIIVNEAAGLFWRLYRDFGKPLSAISRLYALVSGPDRTEAGTPAGSVVTELPEVLQDLAGVCTSHAGVERTMTDLLALPSSATSKIITLPQPVALLDRPRPASARSFEPGSRRGVPPRILWIDRITPTSRPYMLTAVARLRPSYDFVAIGDLENPRRRDGENPFDAQNIVYRSGFEHWDVLPFGDFDAVLATSSSYGLPRAVLAAVAARLPLVTGPSGGVGKLAGEGRGWLVEDDADPEAYASALDNLLFDRDARLRKIEKTTTYMSRVHSRDSFFSRIREIGLFDVA